MILKQLVEVHNFDIVSFIFKQYKRLGLSLEQSLVLMNIFSLLQAKKVVSINTIGKGVNISSSELSEVLNELMESGWLNTTLETSKSTGKQREVFNIDLSYEKIETYLLSTDEDKSSNINDISQTIELLEKSLNRMLKANELETIRAWYDQKLASFTEIKELIAKSKQQISILYLDRILNQKNSKIAPTKANPKVEKAIQTLFKS